ncbi:Adhesion G Protein-Coupled Receptor E1 [Manis pentadactyla]|nr:Adhesion G Protein-Coupled Receptor E1 [Manis pentadactyla]
MTARIAVLEMSFANQKREVNSVVKGYEPHLCTHLWRGPKEVVVLRALSEASEACQPGLRHSLEEVDENNIPKGCPERTTNKNEALMPKIPVF